MMTMPVCFFAGGFDFFGQQFEKKVEFRVDLAIAIFFQCRDISMCYTQSYLYASEIYEIYSAAFAGFLGYVAISPRQNGVFG